MDASLEEIPLKKNDGSPSRLADHHGKVRLLVNVASRCGLTPQYQALEAVYRTYRDRGFEVLAFPANDFGAQEPGTDAEIQAFCSATYDVTFPLFAKIAVTGGEQHPLYARLTREIPEARALPGSDFRAKMAGYGIKPANPADVLWNFEKFLLDREGRVIARFAPDVPPDAEIVRAEIERALG